MSRSNISTGPPGPRPPRGNTSRGIRRRARQRRLRRHLRVIAGRLSRIGEVVWNVAVALYLGAMGFVLLVVVLALLYLGASALLGRQ